MRLLLQPVVHLGRCDGSIHVTRAVFCTARSAAGRIRRGEKLGRNVKTRIVQRNCAPFAGL
jgi:hypothetical protein